MFVKALAAAALAVFVAASYPNEFVVEGRAVSDVEACYEHNRSKSSVLEHPHSDINHPGDFVDAYVAGTCRDNFKAGLF